MMPWVGLCFVALVFPDNTLLLFCLSEKCSDISKPENGTIVFSTDGAITNVEFQCNHGYSLTGPSNISCKSTGIWDQEVPNCGKLYNTVISCLFVV